MSWFVNEVIWPCLKGILKSDHPLIAHNTAELCISVAGIDGPYGEELGVLPKKVLHNGYELAGAIV
jgi:hypothetical protein